MAKQTKGATAVERDRSALGTLEEAEKQAKAAVAACEAKVRACAQRDICFMLLASLVEF